MVLRYNWSSFITSDLIQQELPAIRNIKGSDASRINDSIASGYNMYSNRLRLSGYEVSTYMQAYTIELETYFDSLNVLSLVMFVVTTADDAVYTISGSYDNSTYETIDTVTIDADSVQFNTKLLKQYKYYKFEKASGDGVAEFFIADNVSFNLLVKCCAYRYAESLGINDTDKWALSREALLKDIDNYSRIAVAVDANGNGEIDSSDGYNKCVSHRLSL